MIKSIYCVYEVNEDGSNVIEFFNERRADAIKYYKQRMAFYDGIYAKWNKEVGVYYCKWTNGELSKELYLKTSEFDDEVLAKQLENKSESIK